MAAPDTVFRRSNVSAETEPGHVVNVGVVDQVPIFREALAEHIRHAAGLNFLGSTEALSAAVALCDQGRVDVLVLDAVLDPYGHFARFLTDREPDVVILALLREPLCNLAYVRAASSSGVRGLVRRTLPANGLTEVIRRVARERHYLDPALAHIDAQHVAAHQRRYGQELTERECQVLLLLADGLQSKTIATVLFISVETVRTHLKNIFRKLNARDRAHAVAVGFRNGLIGSQEDSMEPAGPSYLPGNLPMGWAMQSISDRPHGQLADGPSKL